MNISSPYFVVFRDHCSVCGLDPLYATSSKEDKPSEH